MQIDKYKALAIRVGSRAGLRLQKHSPEILVTVGVVGLLTAGVLAARSTLKLEETLDNNDIRIGEFKTETELEPETRAYNRKLTRIYIRNAVDVAKLYALPTSVAVASTVSVFAAHGIMRRRNVALVAAYNVLERQIAQYRERVAAEIGEEREEQLHRGFAIEKIKDENGKKTEVVDLAKSGTPSQYGKLFAKETTSAWSPDPAQNLAWVRAQQQFANDLLISRGHVFLNDVYDSLGLDRTKAGAIVGWVVNDADGVGDNYIDFGIYDFSDDRKIAFINGDENQIWLDFNVDGIIWDKI